MKSILTLLLSLAVVQTAAQPLQLTVREINSISQENIDFLNARGAALSAVEISQNIYNDFLGATVEITAVVLSDPLNSGDADIDGGGLPAKIHVFVRDTAAVSLGFEGMGIELIDSDYQLTGLDQVSIGDVIKVVGTVYGFSPQLGILPNTIEHLGTYDELGIPASVLDPVDITSSLVNSDIGDNKVQTNWSALAELRGQFVRFSYAAVGRRDVKNIDQVDFYLTTDVGKTVVPFYDKSLRFRNDRDDYPAHYNKRLESEGSFLPPVSGSIVSVEGFLVMENGTDGFDRSAPGNMVLAIAPFEDRGCNASIAGLRCDFKVQYFDCHDCDAHHLAWARQVKGESNNILPDLAVSEAGDIAFIGTFNREILLPISATTDTLFGNSGSRDVFIAHFNSYGMLNWAHRIGGTSLDGGYGIFIDQTGNVYATGNFSNELVVGDQVLQSPSGSDFYLIKYDATGAFKWGASSSSPTTASGWRVTVDGQGDAYVAGTFNVEMTLGKDEPNETTLNGLGSDDIFFARFDSEGELLWAKTARRHLSVDDVSPFGTSEGHIGDGTGKSYAIGEFDWTTTFGEGEPNQTTFDVDTEPGVPYIYFAHFDVDGTLLWVKSFGTIGASCHAIGIDDEGNVFLTGDFRETIVFGEGEPNESTLTATGSTDIFIAKFASDGMLQWAKAAGGSGKDKSNDLAMDSDGNIYVVGEFYDDITFGSGEPKVTVLQSAGGGDIFMARFNELGELNWAVRKGGPGLDVGHAVDVDNQGSVFVSGGIQESVIFGLGEPNEIQLVSETGSDQYLSKYIYSEGSPLPVSMSRFGGVLTENGVQLSWVTLSELNNAGFEIQRLLSDGQFVTVGFVTGNGTSIATNSYNFTDPIDGRLARLLTYRLKQIDFDGAFQYSYSISIEYAPETYVLDQNFPNPFNPQTQIKFEIPVSGHTRLEIFDTLGRRIAVLVDDKLEAGVHVVTWHAEAQPNATYFYRIQSGEFRSARSMVLLK